MLDIHPELDDYKQRRRSDMRDEIDFVHHEAYIAGHTDSSRYMTEDFKVNTALETPCTPKKLLSTTTCITTYALEAFFATAKLRATTVDMLMPVTDRCHIHL